MPQGNGGASAPGPVLSNGAGTVVNWVWPAGDPGFWDLEYFDAEGTDEWQHSATLDGNSRSVASVGTSGLIRIRGLAEDEATPVTGYSNELQHSEE